MYGAHGPGIEHLVGFRRLTETLNLSSLCCDTGLTFFLLKYASHVLFFLLLQEGGSLEVVQLSSSARQRRQCEQIW